MKKILIMFAAVGLLSVAGALAQQKPNVLFIMVDDLNADVGFLGDETAKTPNMDRLAEQGTVFANAHCQAPICGPSRNSLLTGKFPHNTGLYGLDPLFREVDELKELTALPQLFRENGYNTPSIGKIYHTKPDPESFDQYYGWFGGFGPRPEKPFHLDPDLPVHPFFDWGPYLTEPETADAQIAQKAVELIKESAGSDQPFFWSVGFFRPHCPLYAPQQWFDAHPLDSVEPVTDQLEDMSDISAYAKKLVNYDVRQEYSEWLRDGRTAGLVPAGLPSLCQFRRPLCGPGARCAGRVGAGGQHHHCSVRGPRRSKRTQKSVV